jgi:hypothetical protein
LQRILLLFSMGVMGQSAAHTTVGTDLTSEIEWGQARIIEGVATWS